MESIAVAIGLSVFSVLLNAGLGIVIYLLKQDRFRMASDIAQLQADVKAHHEGTHVKLAEDIGGLKEAVKRCEMNSPRSLP